MLMALPIVVASSASAQMSLRSAMGYGHLELDPSGVEITSPLIHSGDYNHDGNRDFLFGYGYQDREIFVAIGQGEDHFDVIGPIAPTQSYRSLACGDLDGDGVVELALREIDSNEIRIISTGTGAMSTEIVPMMNYSENSFGYGSFTAIVVSEDLDGDGGSEFVFNTTNQRMFVRWSSRNEDDPYEEIMLPQLQGESTLYPLEDYDGDGDFDILMFDPTSTQFILVEGTGTNTMGIARVLDGAHPRIVVGSNPLFGQFDADPAIDMVVYDLSANTTTIITNFAGSSALPFDISTQFRMIPVGVVGDLDGSGFTDLIVERDGIVPSTAINSFLGALYVDPLEGGSVFLPMVVPPRTRAVSVNNSSFDFFDIPSVDSMDVDGDGDLDLIWFGALIENGLRVTMNRPEIVAAPRFGASYTQGESDPLHIMAIDINGDSQDELVVCGSDSARIYDVVGGTSQSLPNSPGAFMSLSADLDGDGGQELVVVGFRPRLKIYPVLGDGSIGTRITFANPDGADYTSAVVGDFDLDGRDDLAVSNLANGSIQFLRGDGDEGIELWARIDDLAITRVIKPATIDFNQDGAPDLAVGDFNNDQIVFFENNATGTFTRSHQIPSFSPYWLVAADVDLDGVTDIVSVHQRDDIISIHFLDATGQVDERVDLIGSRDMVEVIAEDLVGDSLLDLAATGSSDFAYPVMFEQVSPRVFKYVSYLVSQGTLGIAAGDCNGDGARDIVTVSDVDRSLMVNWGSPDHCPADLSGDGSLSFFDISLFLQKLPDYNHDEIFNFFDVSAFLMDFSNGCP